VIERRAGPEVAQWSTWVLGDPGPFRPAAPSSTGSQEIEEIVTLQQGRTPALDSTIRRWDGDPTSLWTRIAVERLDFYWPLLPDVRVATPVRAARIMALLHVALHDAMIATWDAKYAHGRRGPSQADARVNALVRLDGAPSYPSEHAAAAAAAAAVLTYALPHDDTTTLVRWAREAADSRVAAGVSFRSDVEAGLALGRVVAERVIARAHADGSHDTWTGTIPLGTATWRPTPPRRVAAPFDPMAGSWTPWVIPSGDAYRLDAPPAAATAEFMADMTELQNLAAGGRTLAQINAARYWATDAPTLRWELFLDDELARWRWSTPQAARARAYLSVAMFDAAIACWDTKYTYWLARPVTMDPSLTTVFSTPPFPSYPSGHSTMSTAASIVMRELFPSSSHSWHRKAEEASLSRVWAGVHYRFDVIDGDSLGARVGRAVVSRMRGDGARR
jgi:membrane-associated phospholipid phosphatase